MLDRCPALPESPPPLFPATLLCTTLLSASLLPACPSVAAALAAHPYVYMRWKELFFVRGSECRLTIQGFYYLCLDRCPTAGRWELGWACLGVVWWEVERRMLEL